MQNYPFLSALLPSSLNRDKNKPFDLTFFFFAATSLPSCLHYFWKKKYFFHCSPSLTWPHMAYTAMDYPDLECQTLFSLFRRFPFVGKLMIDTFSQCCSHIEDFVLHPKRELSVTCSHSLPQSAVLSLSYCGNRTCFSLAHPAAHSGPFDTIRSDSAYVSVGSKSVGAYGVRFESRDDVNFWFDCNQKFRTFFVSALFSDEWEAWTQLASNACAGLRYSAVLSPSTFISCGVQSSRTQVSGTVSVFHKLQDKCIGFLNVIVSPTSISPLVVCEKVFSWFSVRYIQGLKSCACELSFEPKGISLGYRIQRSNTGMRKALFFSWT